MINDKADNVIEEMFESLLNRYKISQRITKIKDFIGKYNCKGINYPSEKK